MKFNLLKIIYLILTFNIHSFPESIATRTDSLQNNLFRIYEIKTRSHANLLELRQDISDSLFQILIPYLKYSLYLCENKKPTECPDIIFQLAKLYYLKGTFDYVWNKKKFEGTKNLSPDKLPSTRPSIQSPYFDKAINCYNKLIIKYPAYSKTLIEYSQ